MPSLGDVVAELPVRDSTLAVPIWPEQTPPVLVLQSLNVTVALEASGAPARMPVKFAVSNSSQPCAVLMTGLALLSLLVIVQVAEPPMPTVMLLPLWEPPTHDQALAV